MIWYPVKMDFFAKFTSAQVLNVSLTQKQQNIFFHEKQKKRNNFSPKSEIGYDGLTFFFLFENEGGQPSEFMPTQLVRMLLNVICVCLCEALFVGSPAKCLTQCEWHFIQTNWIEWDRWIVR